MVRVTLAKTISAKIMRKLSGLYEVGNEGEIMRLIGFLD